MPPPREIAEGLGVALRARAGVASAYLFGSAARDHMHRDSDVDVGVLLDREVHPTAADRFDVRLRLTTELRPIAGRDVDLVILNDAPPHLARQIMWDGETLVVNQC